MAFTKVGDSIITKIMDVKDGKIVKTSEVNSISNVCPKCGKNPCECTKTQNLEENNGLKR